VSTELIMMVNRMFHNTKNKIKDLTLFSCQETLTLYASE
jgi:hypothetical protein